MDVVGERVCQVAVVEVLILVGAERAGLVVDGVVVKVRELGERGKSCR